MELELGVGLNPTVPDAVHHDLWKFAPHIDVEHDLDVTPWPWGDGEFTRVVALDVVEHLRVDIVVWLNECWRVLQPGGALEIRVPHYTSDNFYTDPTHRRWFALRTFDYWDRTKELHQKYGCFYFGRNPRWWRITKAAMDGDNILFTLVKEA